MNMRRVGLSVGVMIAGIAAAMLPPALVDLSDGNPDWIVFVGSCLTSLFAAGLIITTCLDDDSTASFSLREGFVLTSLSWLVVAAFAALPFAGLGLSYTDAFFEAMSGLTTTGATVLVGLDNLPRGILLWRSLLQALGGIGIIVTALVMLPFLRVGGMQLFHAESSDRSEKVVPRAAQLMSATAAIYLGLLLACAIAYAVLGMTPFDAICHAMTTVSTGGFSTHDLSFGFYQSAKLQWIAMLFMILGSLPFVVLISVSAGKYSALWRDRQVRGFLVLVGGIGLALSLWIVASKDVSFPQALTAAMFNVISIVTTTGFATEDYQLWGPLAVAVFFLLTFVGGCAGSTAGGIKVYRLQIALVLTRMHLSHLTTPHRIVPLRYNNMPMREDVPFSVIAFITVYLFTVGFFTLLLAALGLDLVTALTAAATAIGNVGPGLGEIVGPAGNFATLPVSAKWILSMAMLLGRLELFTVLVILQPEFWRN